MPMARDCNKTKTPVPREAWKVLEAEEAQEAREDQVRHLPNPAVSKFAVSKFVTLQIRYRSSLSLTTEVADKVEGVVDKIEEVVEEVEEVAQVKNLLRI